jgi:hypothetical protein
MSFVRLLRISSQSTLTRSGPTDTEGSTSDNSNIPRRERQASELMAAIRLPWKAKRTPSTGHSSPSQPTPTSPLASRSHTSESGVDEITLPAPAVSSVLLTNVAIVPSPEMVSATISPMPDRFSDAWDAVKDDPKITHMSRALDTVGVSSAWSSAPSHPF